MDIIQSVLAVIVVLGVLVSIHEWGHFIVARMCGVKVLRFSVGFGTPFYSKTDKKGTEFVLAAIPLGGYVKMVDEREGGVSEEDLPFAFNRKPVLQRIAIVAAGPIINLLFAVVIYWGIYIGEQEVLAPYIGEIEQGTIAFDAGLKLGDELVSVDGKHVNSWDEVIQHLVLKVLEPGEIQLEVLSEGTSSTRLKTLELAVALKINEDTNPLEALGITPKMVAIPAIIGEIVSGGAAEQAGLKAGDEILTANSEAVESWQSWVEMIRQNPGGYLNLELRRDGQVKVLDLKPGIKQGSNGESYGYIGAGVAEFEWPSHLVKKFNYGPVEALNFAIVKTYDNCSLILLSTWKLVTGDLAKDNLGGPIMIANLAGRYAGYGIEPFLLFLAYISIVLGIMNLLPIPVLDGGHIFFFLIELVARRPVPEKIQMLGMKMGLALLLLVMTFAVYNDIQRLLLGSF